MPEDTTLHVGRCVLDPVARELTCDGEPVQLSPRELQLAHLLMSHADRVVTRREALEAVWGSAARENVLDVYIRYLRARLGADAIATARGIGYRFLG
ncbi:winged helix-turn-helix domain-containing protein [Demequina gelatinilytica]|uniref:winged helix-turn-helix domain-containing protein n=1 Tax=Demequina gelatinilytica TaxID=1638980 RepID=UPI0007828DA0|nr:winged helix-turn-helix domain-containing protein [Demequina gelatinilytica]